MLDSCQPRPILRSGRPPRSLNAESRRPERGFGRWVSKASCGYEHLSCSGFPQLSSLRRPDSSFVLRERKGCRLVWSLLPCHRRASSSRGPPRITMPAIAYFGTVTSSATQGAPSSRTAMSAPVSRIATEFLLSIRVVECPVRYLRALSRLPPSARSRSIRSKANQGVATSSISETFLSWSSEIRRRH